MSSLEDPVIDLNRADSHLRSLEPDAQVRTAYHFASLAEETWVASAPEAPRRAVEAAMVGLRSWMNSGTATSNHRALAVESYTAVASSGLPHDHIARQTGFAITHAAFALAFLVEKAFAKIAHSSVAYLGHALAVVEFAGRSVDDVLLTDRLFKPRCFDPAPTMTRRELAAIAKRLGPAVGLTAKGPLLL